MWFDDMTCQKNVAVMMDCASSVEIKCGGGVAYRTIIAVAQAAALASSCPFTGSGSLG
jgi:hypothetical protein